VSICDILDTYRRLAAVPLTAVEDPALMRPLEQKGQDRRRIEAARARLEARMQPRPDFGLDSRLLALDQVLMRNGRLTA